MTLLICARRKLPFAVKLFLQMIICSNQQWIVYLRELVKDCIITGFINDAEPCAERSHIVKRRSTIFQNVKTLDLLSQFRKAGRFGLTGQRLAGWSSPAWAAFGCSFLAVWWLVGFHVFSEPLSLEFRGFASLDIWTLRFIPSLEIWNFDAWCPSSTGQGRRASGSDFGKASKIDISETLSCQSRAFSNAQSKRARIRS